MKDVCCACGKSVRFSMLLGDTGQRLMDGYVCYDCVKLAGYGKGFFSAMGLAATSKSEFLNKYNSSPKVIKKAEAEAKKAQQVATAKMNTFNNDLSKMTYEQLQNEMQKYIVSNFLLQIKDLYVIQLN